MRLSNNCSWYLVFPSLRLDNIARISYFRTLSTMNIYHEHDPHYFIFFFSWAKSLRLAEVDKKGNFQRIISLILNIFLWNKYDVREFFFVLLGAINQIAVALPGRPNEITDMTQEGSFQFIVLYREFPDHHDLKWIMFFEIQDQTIQADIFAIPGLSRIFSFCITSYSEFLISS